MSLCAYSACVRLEVPIIVNIPIGQVRDEPLVFELAQPVLRVEELADRAVFTMECFEVKIGREAAGNTGYSIEVRSRCVTGRQAIVVLRHGEHEIGNAFSIRIFLYVSRTVFCRAAL